MQRGVNHILSADIYSFIAQSGLTRDPRNVPVAQNSSLDSLGWQILGPTEKPSTGQSIAAFHISIDDNLAHALPRFWEIMEVPKKQSNCMDEPHSTRSFKCKSPSNAQPTLLSLKKNLMNMLHQASMYEKCTSISQ